MYSIEEIKSKITPFAKANNLKSVYVFGSYARGEANEDSDIDILVYDNESRGLFSIADLMCQLENIMGKNVDLVFADDVYCDSNLEENAQFIQSMEKDRVSVYES